MRITNPFLIIYILLFSSYSLADEGALDRCKTVEKTLKYEDARGYLIFADCLYSGNYGTKDTTKAVNTWIKSAVLGESKAALNLGVHLTFLSEETDPLGPVLLKLALTDHKQQASRYLGLYFMNDGRKEYSTSRDWAYFYLNQSYENGDYIAAYILAYASKSGFFLNTDDEYSEWIEKGKLLDTNNIGYNRVISEFLELGFLNE